MRVLTGDWRRRRLTGRERWSLIQLRLSRVGRCSVRARLPGSTGLITSLHLETFGSVEGRGLASDTPLCRVWLDWKACMTGFERLGRVFEEKEKDEGLRRPASSVSSSFAPHSTCSSAVCCCTHINDSSMSVRRLVTGGPARIRLPQPSRHSTRFPRPETSCAAPLVNRLLLSDFARRGYQHASSHAPASRERSNPSSTCSESQAHNGIAYSRHELISSWHAAARDVSPREISFEKRETIDVNCKSLPFFVSARISLHVLKRFALRRSQTWSCAPMERLSVPLRSSRKIDSCRTLASWCADRLHSFVRTC